MSEPVTIDTYQKLADNLLKTSEAFKEARNVDTATKFMAAVEDAFEFELMNEKNFLAHVTLLAPYLPVS